MMAHRARSWLRSAGVVASIFLLPGTAAAWGQDGHDYIATAARDLLHQRNPGLEARFQAILHGDILNFRGTSTEADRHAVQCHGRTLREIASWADCIRYTRERRNTGGFHYDDVALCDDEPAPPPPPFPGYCRRGNCGSHALSRFIGILSNDQAPRRERAEALAWILHIVGDLHQPLHATDNDDIGGNNVSIRLTADAFGERRFSARKLHSLWDTPMVYAAVGEGAEAADAVRALAVQHLSDWRQSDIRQWVLGSHRIGQQAYRALPNPPACGAGETDGGLVTRNYVDGFDDDVRDQLGKAAVRLADILEQALS